jgi:hypothetical protein
LRNNRSESDARSPSSRELTRDVSVSDVADLSILKEAQRELGIKAK